MGPKASKWVAEACRFAASKRIVSFDFDDTLTVPYWDDRNKSWGAGGANHEMIDLLKMLASEGDAVFIVTARHADGEDERRRRGESVVSEFIRQHDLPVLDVIFTNGEPKGPFLAELGVSEHYDDHPDEVVSASENGVRCVRVPHPQDVIVENGALPDSPTEDQVKFWEWHRRSMGLKGE